MSNVKISVITVCYNSEKTIERTLECMLNQSYRNFEYIIIDGASKDRTIDIVHRYEPLFDGKMKVISEPDHGIYDAMNKGIRNSTGELIGIVNSDDYYEPNALEVMAKNYKNEKHLVMYGFQRCVSNGEEEKVVIFHHSRLDQQMITHPTCFVSRAVYEDFGMFNLTYKSSADYELMLRLYHKTDTIFKPIYAIISNFEAGGMSGSQVGVRETAKLRYSYHLISRSRYYSILLRSRLYDVKQLIFRGQH